jgi:hypothetical protein
MSVAEPDSLSGSADGWTVADGSAHYWPVSWKIRGSYFESCNCDAICPCRRIDGVPGGRSTYGECLGVLSWMIDDGHADDVSLDSLKVALATRYHDDEAGSPWSFVMYVDRGRTPHSATRSRASTRGGSAATRSRTFRGRGRRRGALRSGRSRSRSRMSRAGNGSACATT